MLNTIKDKYFYSNAELRLCVNTSLNLFPKFQCGFVISYLHSVLFCFIHNLSNGNCEIVPPNLVGAPHISTQSTLMVKKLPLFPHNSTIRASAVSCVSIDELILWLHQCAGPTNLLKRECQRTWSCWLSLQQSCQWKQVHNPLVFKSGQ